MKKFLSVIFVSLLLASGAKAEEVRVEVVPNNLPPVEAKVKPAPIDALQEVPLSEGAHQRTLERARNWHRSVIENLKDDSPTVPLFGIRHTSRNVEKCSDTPEGRAFCSDILKSNIEVRRANQKVLTSVSGLVSSRKFGDMFHVSSEDMHYSNEVIVHEEAIMRNKQIAKKAYDLNDADERTLINTLLRKFKAKRLKLVLDVPDNYNVVTELRTLEKTAIVPVSLQLLGEDGKVLQEFRSVGTSEDYEHTSGLVRNVLKALELASPKSWAAATELVDTKDGDINSQIHDELFDTIIK